MFVFNGSRTAPTKSYVLLFDQTTQKAALERLDSTYTFNLSTHNKTDVSAEHAKIYPKKPHKDSVHDRESGDEGLFGDEEREQGDEGIQPETNNPYDFRHFLNAGKKKDKDGASTDAGYASSPDYRSTQHSTSANDAPVSSRAAMPKKRKAASVFTARAPAKSAAGPKKTNASAARTARPAAAQAAAKPAPSSSGSKIKSAEFVAESDDSDLDAEGELDSAAASPHPHPMPQHQASPGHRSDDEDAEGEDDDSDHDHNHGHMDDSDDDDARNNRHEHADSDSDSDSGLHIEVPDASPPLTHRSGLAPPARAPSPPAKAPMSLASAANSNVGTPRKPQGAAEIDFGDLDADDDGADGGERDARGAKDKAGATRADEVDEDDPLYMEMMEGLAGGDSSEESEEE